MVTITSKKAFKYVPTQSGEMTEIDIIEAYGLAADTKPTDNVANGSAFVEMDSGKVYFYDEANQTWIAFGGSGS